MTQFLKDLIKRTPLYPPFRRWALSRRQQAEVAEWERKGRPAPPPHPIKQQAIIELAARYGLRVLVETGTYYGDMVDAMRPHFERVYSIELSRELHQQAARRFASDPRVEIIHGDSGKELGKLVKRLDRPALFWLDGHYSAGVTARGDRDTPVLEELEHILDGRRQGDVIIIDDARCFGSDPTYPSLDELKAFILARAPRAVIELVHDGLRVLPPSAP